MENRQLSRRAGTRGAAAFAAIPVSATVAEAAGQLSLWEKLVQKTKDWADRRFGRRKPITSAAAQREAIIAAALDTKEGRTALAQAMCEPIKTSLMYQGIGRKLLMVDELPQGAIPRYERDIAVRSYVVPKRPKFDAQGWPA